MVKSIPIKWRFSRQSQELKTKGPILSLFISIAANKPILQWQQYFSLLLSQTPSISKQYRHRSVIFSHIQASWTSLFYTTKNSSVEKLTFGNYCMVDIFGFTFNQGGRFGWSIQCHEASTVGEISFRVLKRW